MVVHQVHLVTFTQKPRLLQEFLCMLRLHGIPVPSTALPKVHRNSQNLFTSHSPAATPASSAADSISFMSSMGSRRIFARNGGSGTVASVHQFGLEDTATMMEADCDEEAQASVSDMEEAVEVILQEIGEDLERPVSSLVPSQLCCSPQCSRPASL